MDILTYINRMNQIYGNGQQAAPVYNTQKYLQGGRVGYQSGQLVQPGPGRPGYSGKYITGKELEKLTGIPDLAVKAKELMYQPKAEKRQKNIFGDFYKKELKAKYIDIGQGGQYGTLHYLKPTKAQIKKIKDYHLRRGAKYGLTEDTIKGMKQFYNDPTLKKYIRKGEFVPNKILKARDIGANKAANITFRLAQHLNGKKFANVDVDLPVNKSVAKKIFKKIEKAPFGNPYQQTAYKESMDIITKELGQEYFGNKNLETMKREARRILNREGVPTFDPTVKGSTGFNINEIIGIKTGARIKGLTPYSQFINVMEGKLNTVQYANFVRQFEKFNNRMQTENKADVIKDYNKYRKKFLKTNPKVKDTDIPKFSLQSPEKVYGKNRITNLTKEGLDLNKSYDEIGYTIDVGKKTRTLKEFITNPKNIGRLKKFGKAGAITAGAVTLPSIVSASESDVTKAGMSIPSAGQLATGALATSIGSKFMKSDPLKYLRKGIRKVGSSLLTPTGAGALWAATGGFDYKDPLDRAALSAEAAFAPELVKWTSKLTKPIKNQAVRAGVTQLLNLGMTPQMAMKAARVASPLGWISLGAEGLYQIHKTAQEVAKNPEMLERARQSNLEMAKAAEESGVQDVYAKGDELMFKLGGRVPFKFGGIDKGRRAFMKLLAGLGIGTATVGTGLIKLSKGAKTVAPQVTEEVIKRGADGIPSYAWDLIKVVKAKGIKKIVDSDVNKYPDTVHSYKGVEVIDEMGLPYEMGGVTRIKRPTEGVATDASTGKMHEGISKEIEMEIKPSDNEVFTDPESGMSWYIEPGKGRRVYETKPPDEYMEGTVRPDNEGKMKDFEEGIDDVDHLELKKIADEGTYDTSLPDIDDID